MKPGDRVVHIHDRSKGVVLEFSHRTIRGDWWCVAFLKGSLILTMPQVLLKLDESPLHE